MQSIIRLLKFISDNWASIVMIVALLAGLYLKAKKAIQDWNNKTEAEQEAEIKEAQNKALKALKETILALVSNAEIGWSESGQHLGSIKRSEVIGQIFTMYPILLTVTDQDELTKKIDNMIDDALNTVREKIRV